MCAFPVVGLGPALFKIVTLSLGVEVLLQPTWHNPYSHPSVPRINMIALSHPSLFLPKDKQAVRAG